ncbi:MAG: GNAT family N-acetyltransferase [Eubacteriales bacterium]|nr:GNAT family N-acetyltransferase [Eubacteriales bacterium]
MRFERIKGAEHRMYEQALRLYRISFPPHEQREALSQKRILGDGEYHFDLIYDEELFVGLALYWETEQFLYLEHFCILPEARNRRYGQKVLEKLKERQKTLILEIDPPEDDISIRRKGFYERCGFVENPYSHVHPPYHSGNDGHRLRIMTCPGQIDREMYEEFAEYLSSRVMDGAYSC